MPVGGSAEASLHLPGDDVILDAGLVFDRGTTLDAPPEQVWPWVVQLGKKRAGWYAPRGVERFIPGERRALRHVEDRWQHLERGDRVPDYGGKDEWFEVAHIDPPNALVYRSERKAGVFSWALVLSPLEGERTLLHVRFRGTLTSTGLKRKVIERGGAFFDALTVEIMFAGLRERVLS